jgi:hypothetical protein
MNPKLFALHGHWCIAASVKYAVFHESGDAREAELIKQLGPELSTFAELQLSMYRLSVFYALSYVVVEGYREIDDPSDEKNPTG